MKETESWVIKIIRGIALYIALLVMCGFIRSLVTGEEMLWSMIQCLECVGYIYFGGYIFIQICKGWSYIETMAKDIEDLKSSIEG